VAAMQVLVYAGAIMVLFVFVIMLLNADAPSLDMIRSHTGLRLMSALACMILFGFLVFAFHESNYPAPTGTLTPEHVVELGGNTRAISELMFSDYALPFDLTSVLLLGAIVGAVAIAKRKQNYAVSPDRAAYGIHPTQRREKTA
jgi:NADH-quinone oxidoreductase subunit J